MDGVSTFDHDADARHDPKFVSIMKGRGAAAYAWVFMLWEYLYQNGGGIPVDMFFDTVIRDQTRMPEEMDAADFIDQSVKLGLFYYDKKIKDKTFLRSSGIDKRLQEVKSRSLIYAKNSSTRWAKKLESLGITAEAINTIYESYPKKVDPEKSKSYIRRDLLAEKITVSDMLSKVKDFAAGVSRFKNTDNWQYVAGSAPWFRREGWREDLPAWTKKSATAGRAAAGEDYERGKRK
jgi:hypothetical protein